MLRSVVIFLEPTSFLWHIAMRLCIQGMDGGCRWIELPIDSLLYDLWSIIHSDMATDPDMHLSVVYHKILSCKIDSATDRRD